MRPVCLGKTVLLLAATFAVSSGARAQVLEIGADGAVTVYDRPAVVTAAGAQAILRREASPVIAVPSAEVAGHIRDAAAAYALDRQLLESVAWRESRFRQDATSRKGAAGVMQLMPGTARDLGVDSADPRQNIFGGAAYLKTQLLRFGGDVSLALAAYNAGPGAVLRYGGVPPFAETRSYVAAITRRLGQSTLKATSSVIASPAAAAALDN